jgi:hypothetical protein
VVTAGSGSPARRALAANARRNSAAGPNRLWRWRDTRAAAWTLLERHVGPGAAVAVVGAGNGHDLPLHRLGRRAGRLDLVDLDVRALHRTRRRLLLSGVRADGIAQDVTHGMADAVIRDVVARRTVVAGLSAAAPGGPLICIEDVLRWGVDHHQPFSVDQVLAAAEADPDRALELVQRSKQPRGCNGRLALGSAGAQVVDRAFWHWPFAPGTDYLVCATVARCTSAARY